MSISLKKSGMLKLGLSLVAMTVAASVQAKTPFIVQKARRKALTHSSSPLAPPMTPVPYRSTIAWSNSKPVRRKLFWTG